MDPEETEARNDCAGETSSNLTDPPGIKGLTKLRINEKDRFQSEQVSSQTYS
jgi:hypothetical protein